MLFPPFSEQADIAHPAGDGIDQHDDGKVDHVQAQADGRGVGILRLGGRDADAVDIDAEDVRGGHVSAGLQQQRLVRVGREQGAAVQDQHHHGDGNQVGNIDVLDLVPAGGAVDGGRLIQLGVDAGQGGDVQDRVPPRVLPDLRSDEQGPEPSRLHDEVNALAPRRGDQVVDDAVGRGKKQVNHARQHHGGNEMGHVDGGLGKPLEALAVQLVQQDRQQDRDREAEQQPVQVEQEGVQEHPAAVIAAEELFKVLEAHPFAAGDAEGGLVIAEGNLHAVHGKIAEHDEEARAGSSSTHSCQSRYSANSWNLPLKHPVNIAYEAATADLNDVNMIDPFHLEAYDKIAVNYNRDIEIFPVLNALFEGIYGESPYKSPTDMGVNMVGFCISDDDVCCQASRDEIIRRYYSATNKMAEGADNEREVNKILLLFNQAKITTAYRRVTVAATAKQELTEHTAAAMELSDGTIITSKSSPLLGCSAALLLNATKHLAGIGHDVKLIPQSLIEPVQKTKIEYLGGNNPRLHTDEVLVALSVLSKDDELCRKALEQFPRLRGCQVHSTVMLSEVDRKIFKKLGCGLTCDPVKKK